MTTTDITVIIVAAIMTAPELARIIAANAKARRTHELAMADKKGSEP